MSEDDLNRLRLKALQFFLAEAQPSSEFLRLPVVRRHPRRWTRRFVQALALAGLLERWGATSGTWYRTSHLGYIVLVALNEMLTVNPKNRSRTGYTENK